MATRRLINNMPFMVATCYGFSAGPTWPDNKRLTSQLLATLSQDLVVGGTGPRIITGDSIALASNLRSSNCGKVMVGLKHNNMHINVGNNPLFPLAKDQQLLTYCGCLQKLLECAEMPGISAPFLTM